MTQETSSEQQTGQLQSEAAEILKDIHAVLMKHNLGTELECVVLSVHVLDTLKKFSRTVQLHKQLESQNASQT